MRFLIVVLVVAHKEYLVMRHTVVLVIALVIYPKAIAMAALLLAILIF